VIVWHVPPRREAPVFLYFHGNGGSLRWREERFRALIADGSGLVALSYRGYGGSKAIIYKSQHWTFAFSFSRSPARRASGVSRISNNARRESRS
jgi:hypothetical protein